MGRQIVDLEHELRPAAGERLAAGQPAHGRKTVILAAILHALERHSQGRLRITLGNPQPDSHTHPPCWGRRKWIAPHGGEAIDRREADGTAGGAIRAGHELHRAAARLDKFPAPHSTGSRPLGRGGVACTGQFESWIVEHIQRPRRLEHGTTTAKVGQLHCDRTPHLVVIFHPRPLHRHTTIEHERANLPGLQRHGRTAGRVEWQPRAIDGIDHGRWGTCERQPGTTLGRPGVGDADHRQPLVAPAANHQRRGQRFGQFKSAAGDRRKGL